MFNPERLLGQVISGSFGGFGRQVSETNRSLSQMGGMGGFGGSAKLGMGLGLLGVAVAAFEHFKGADSAAPPPPPAGLPPPPPMQPPPVARGIELQTAPAQSTQTGSAPSASSAPALHLLRSMIAAAHADGILDAQERAAIVGRAREAGLPPDDLMALGAELMSPCTLDALVDQTPAGLERETYAAALLAIRVDHSAEQQHLDQLAQALRLSAADRDSIHQQVAAI